MEGVQDFLARCNGNPPGDWLDPGTPHTAAWCAVDLALLDTFGRAFERDLHDLDTLLRHAGRRISFGVPFSGPRQELP